MNSLTYNEYLKKIKTQKLYIKIWQIALIIFFITIWEFLASKNYINTFITSSPSKIIETILNQKNLFRHIFVTVYETLISFSLGTIIGIIIATILWWKETIRKIIDPYLTILNSLPKVSLGPIIIIWFGAGINSIIIMSLLISVIITIINVTNSFLETDKEKIKLLQSFKASKLQIYQKLVLPSSKNTIISSLKINISMSLIGLLPPVGEN